MGETAGPESGWARLSAGLLHDPAWLACKAPARLVFLTSIPLAKATGADGLISLRAMIATMWGALEPTEVEDAAVELVDRNLWLATDDPYEFMVRSFLKWNESQNQIDRRRTQKTIGAHKTNHRFGRHDDDPHPDCPLCKSPGGDATASLERPLERTEERTEERDAKRTLMGTLRRDTDETQTRRDTDETRRDKNPPPSTVTQRGDRSKPNGTGHTFDPETIAASRARNLEKEADRHAQERERAAARVARLEREQAYYR